MTLFLISLMTFYSYISYALFFCNYFEKQRNKIKWRIHINGIRGKSTVTRYVAAVFRESGYHTFGKTTGSAARIIQPDGEDFDFKRKGYPNINEQVKIVKEFCHQKAEAIVMECMATNPVYAQWLEEKVMNSHLGILTNVRYDHADQMGETLEEIAESLSKTIPSNGILITAETNPRLLQILKKNAIQKNSQLVVATKHQVSSRDLEGFSHFAIEENIAIGYEVAQILGVSKERALKAMQSAIADPGAFALQRISFEGHEIVWANLFAVNDRESFIELCHKLFKQYPNYTRVVILNNRHDRPTRVELFAHMAQDLEFNRVITFGDYESAVNEVFSAEPTRVINLGNSSRFKAASAIETLSQIAYGLSSQIILIGTVNIHTPQAERIIHFFDEQDNRVGKSAELKVLSNV